VSRYPSETFTCNDERNMSQTSTLSQSPSRCDSTTTFLFGGDQAWSPLDWIASDDRVRGGKSFSELTCFPFSTSAEFHGNLDIETLGGAGFASQRTTGEDRRWDLSRYEGLWLHVEKSDGKMYTLILKDELLPKSPDGREQSTVSWEYDFKIETDKENAEDRGKGKKIFAKWDEFKPTYRGKEKQGAKPLDLKSVKRISLMMRSFFGTQQGEFSLKIISISATQKPSDFDSPDLKLSERYQDDPNEKVKPWRMNENEADSQQDPLSSRSGFRNSPQGLFSLFWGWCISM